MSWYEFRRDYANFNGWLPSGKNVTDLGFTYPELCCIGGWYFAPVQGSGQRRFYNRWYIDRTGTDIDEYLTAYIDCGKTNFGKLIIKHHEPFMNEWSDEKTKEETKKMKEYFDFITEQVHKSWIVLIPDSRSDNGYMFDNKNEALEFANTCYDHLSDYMKKKYGVEMYQPQNTVPIYRLGGRE